MSINEIQLEISSLFCRYKIPVITNDIPIDNLHRWSFEVAAHFSLNEENLSKVMSELFWSAAHVQLSLGHALIAGEDCRFPKGAKGSAFKEEDIPVAIGLAEIHFWYHLYNSYECIYRCWERITSVLRTVCYPQFSKKMYFDQLVTSLEGDTKYSRNPYLKDLKKKIKHWNSAACARNEISHGKSSPFRNMSIEGRVSNILALNGKPQIYLNYFIGSPKIAIEQIVDKYKKVFPAMKVMVDFIDNIDR